MPSETKKPGTPGEHAAPLEGDFTLTPHNAAAAREAALKKTEEIRAKKALTKEEKAFIEKVEASAKPEDIETKRIEKAAQQAVVDKFEKERAPKPTQSPTEDELRQIREAREEAVAASEELLPDASIEPAAEQVTLEQTVEPVHEQEPDTLEAEPLEIPTESYPELPRSREKTRQLDRLAEFTREQLLTALNQSVALREALDKNDSPSADAIINSSKVLFTRTSVTESGRFIRDSIDIKPDTGDEQEEDFPFEPVMYREKPVHVKSELSEHRMEMISTELAFPIRRVERKMDQKDPSKTIQEAIIEVRNLLPELQRSIFVGTLTFAELEPKLSMSIDAEERRRLSMADWANQSLNAGEWDDIRRACELLDEQRFSPQRNLLERLPQEASRLKSQRIDLAHTEVSRQIEPWLAELSSRERRAIDKYISTAIELYSGRLSQK